MNDKGMTTLRRIAFFVGIALCLSALVTPPLALLLGLVVAQTVGHPYAHLNHRAVQFLLQISVVGLGFGMNVESALHAGREGLAFTIVSILATLVLGYFLGRLLRVEARTSDLISVGTAICGGSAIAAISPIIKAEEKQISVALGTVFILNAVALFLFPMIGHALDLSESRFGLWCAIAIHDTSSVVGAASRYGPQALEIATTVKLTRALWIIPLAFIAMLRSKNSEGRIKVPYFIGLFVVAMVLNSYVPGVAEISGSLVSLAKIGLTLTLFLIGCGCSREALRDVGIRPLLQGVGLWAIVSVTALWAIMHFTA
jgi:uncharacterized integral membrane protein (TIGR00698 family)